VLGFGGRVIDSDQNQPKYINSPETPIYQKSYILFGLYQARHAIREKDQAIFVEGYTDLLSMYQAGVKNVVATSGTALTLYQARLIRRYTENIALLYDADSAGSTATMRGADIFLDEGLEVNIITLAAGSDPDSFIRDHGALRFKELLNHPQSIFQFKINTLSKKFDSSTSKGINQIINEILTSIARIKNSVKQNLAIKELSEHFGIDERALMHQLVSMKQTGRIQPVSLDQKVPPKPIAKSKYDVAEEDLLRLVLEDSKWLPKIFAYLHLDEFESREHRELFSIILGLFQKNEIYDKKEILNLITDPATSSNIAGILMKKIGASTDRQRLFEDCLVLLKGRKFEIRMHNLAQEIKLAQEKEQDASEYIQKYRECRESLKKVETKQFLNESTSLNPTEDF
jgi:DNA primase